MKKEILKEILIGCCVFIIIILCLAVSLNYMENRIRNDCEKQNYMGIKEYWDLDVDCFQFSNIPNITKVGVRK